MPDPAAGEPMSFPACPPSTVVRARADVAVWEWGSGPPVLMLHGFPDHPVGLEPTAAALAQFGFRCICPALPGYWPSAPAPDLDYSPSAIGRDLVAVLDALNVERAALVGHDWGAELGFPLVAAVPERFSRFVSIAVPHPTGYAARRAIFGELRSAWYAIFLAFAPGAPEIARSNSWLTSLVHSWSPGLHWPAWPTVESLIRRPGVMEAVCSYYRANLEASPGAPVIPIPATIIHGGQDGCISPLAYADFGSFFPAGIDRLFLPEVGHWPHLEAPEAVIDFIVGALRQDAE